MLGAHLGATHLGAKSSEARPSIQQRHSRRLDTNDGGKALTRLVRKESRLSKIERCYTLYVRGGTNLQRAGSGLGIATSKTRCVDVDR